MKLLVNRFYLFCESFNARRIVFYFYVIWITGFEYCVLKISDSLLILETVHPSCTPIAQNLSLWRIKGYIKFVIA